MGNTATTENQKMITENIIATRLTRKGRDYQQISLYKDVNPLDWEDWHWQMKNRITKLEQISQVIKLTPEEEEGIKTAKGRMSMAITPYWATLIDADDPACPIRRQSVPTAQEFKVGPYEMVDPCGEDTDSPAPYFRNRFFFVRKNRRVFLFMENEGIPGQRRTWPDPDFLLPCAFGSRDGKTGKGNRIQDPSCHRMQ